MCSLSERPQRKMAGASQERLGKRLPAKPFPPEKGCVRSSLSAVWTYSTVIFWR